MRKIEININKIHMTIEDALEKKGFTSIEKDSHMLYDIGWLDEYMVIFSKDNKYYGVVKFDSHNRFIYDAELLEVDELEELRDAMLNKKLDEYRDSLMGLQLTIREFDDICSKEMEDDNETIFNYEADEIIWNYKKGKTCVGAESSFTYLNTFNVVFKVVADANEFEDIIVEITNVEIV